MIRKEKMKKSDKKEQIVKKKDEAEKTTSNSNSTVPIVNMFKLMPQAKFKVTKKKNITPPIPILFKKNEMSGTKPKNQISKFMEKTEPKKFKVPTGQ